MRIGLITGEYPPMEGGVGAFTRELAVAMAAQGHTIHVCTDRQSQHSSEPGVTITCPIKRWDVASIFQIRRWATDQQLDVLNLQYEPAAFRMSGLVNFMPRLIGRTKFVTTFHDLLVPYLFPKAGPLRYQAVLFLARHSSGVIVTNRHDELKLKNSLIQPGDLSPGNGANQPICNIPIGSNIPVAPPTSYDRTAWRKALNIPDQATLIGYFGFMNASKGVETLLKGVAKAVENGVNAYLVLIGGRTGSSDVTNIAHADEIDSLIAALNLTSRVKRTGFVDSHSVTGYLLTCDMVALPYNDGVSFRRGSFMAALAHGCAIITTTPSVDLPELVHGENIYLIPPENPDVLAQAINTLSKEPILRQRLGQGAKLLSRGFEWDSIATRTVQFFEEIIG